MVLTKVANESLNGLPGAIGNWAEDTFKEPLKALKIKILSL
jgi:hypothetical protein